MGFRWDFGFITDKDVYLEQMIPIPDEELDFAGDLLTNFQEYWDRAQDNLREQERLFNLMLARIWADVGQITQLHLRPNLHVAAGLDVKRPTEISVDLDCYQNGSDGDRALASIHLLAFISRHITVCYFSTANGSLANSS